MKHLRRSVVALLTLALLLTAGSAFAVTVPVDKFTDIPNDWSKEWVTRGINEGIINGFAVKNTDQYEVKASAKVSEAQFVTMLLRTVANEELVKAEDSSWWAKGTYTVSSKYNLPTKTKALTDNAIANANIRRGDTAKIVAKALSGELMTEVNAVQWLYDNNLSEGRSGKTYTGFAPNESLTRAEAVKFILTMKDKGFTKIINENEIVPEVIGIE